MAVVNKQPVVYYQTDPRWKNDSYSAKGESTTIGASGCGPTAMSMVLATWADKNVTPKTECAWALAHGYKAPHQGTHYSYFVPAAKRYNLTCIQINSASIYGNQNSQHHATAKNYLDNGDLVIACMGKGLWTRSGHYVLLYGIEGNMVYINDPASSNIARTHGNYLAFKQQVKYYWAIKRPLHIPVTDEITYSSADFVVKVLDREGLNCRKGPGTSYEVINVYPLETEIRISQTSSNGWGKSSSGWINLTNTERVNELDMTIDEMLSKMTDEQAYALYNKAMAYASKLKEPGWSREEGYWEKATQAGMTDGSAPERPVKRDEFAAMLGRKGLL